MGIGEIFLWAVVIILVLDRFPNLLIVLLIVWLFMHQREVMYFLNHRIDFHD